MAQQDTGSCGTSRIWDGTNINMFGGKGELLNGVLYLLNTSGSAASNVTVGISSFTGASTWGSVAVSSTNVWDYSHRPLVLTKYNNTQILGFDNNGPSWSPSEYEERQVPVRFQVPCTVNVNNDCTPNNATWLWTNRADANKFYPDAAVPIEEYQTGFTVPASSSQAVGFEIYIATTIAAGNYNSSIQVSVNGTQFISIPLKLIVYNFSMPGTASLPVIGYAPNSDINLRINGTEFPANQFVDPYLTTKLRISAFFHRHKIIEIGDQPASTQDSPSVEYQKHIDGTAYTSTYGCGGPGCGVGDPFYMIGTYGSWQSVNWSTSAVTGSNGFGTNAAKWATYCSTSAIHCALYTSIDEASNANLAGQVNTLSTWISTAPAASGSGGVRLNYFQTGNLPGVVMNAPYVNTVASTQWLTYSSTTWQTYENQYQTTGSTQAWMYNSGINSPPMFSGMASGIGPRAAFWAAFKTGQQGYFLWNTTEWIDTNNGGQAQNGFNADTSGNNNLLTISKTFGYDAFPTTSTIKGHTGFAFTNRDGNLIYPGTDTVYTSESFGFNGVIGSWRLNMVTRGIQDYDILKMANSINPSATTSIVNSLIQNVMWFTPCFTLSDCTYSYGPQQWTEDANSYEVARESLEQLIAGTTPPAPSSSSKTLGGKVTLTGRVILQ